MVYALIGCFIVIGFLGFKLFQKQKIDKTILEKYKADIETVRNELHNVEVESLAIIQKSAKCKAEYEDYKEKREYEEYKLEECKKDLQTALDTYHDITDNKLREIDATIEEQRQKRQEELNKDFDTRKELMEKALNEIQTECEKQEKAYKDAAEQVYVDCNDKVSHYMVWTESFKQKFESIQAALRLYDAEKQAKLYYTIQLPEEFQEDIEYLLTTVADKVQHPDIISKLIWAEYVKPNLEDTFKRIEIKAEPGIYKLTSLINGKCYIGKSVDVKKRIADHFKSSIGLSTISDQEVHHIIKKEGFWNWMIEVITYCEKDKLGELEKYYIDFFKSQTYGYNKRAGG